MSVPIAHFPDISHFEPVEDFHAIAGGGCPLVVCKATEGLGYTDPTYAPFAARIRSVPGIVLGAYVFLDPIPAGGQVSHFLNVSHLQSGDLMPIIDAEALGLSAQETNDAVDGLVSQGYDPILYCNLDFLTNTLGGKTDCPVWLAAYRDTLPTLPAGIHLIAWQHTDHGVCPGVGQPCDMSYLYVDLKDYLIP